MGNRRWLSARAVLALVVGMIGPLMLVGRPRFEAFHTVDVLQLLASGMCFGVASAILLPMLLGPRKA